MRDQARMLEVVGRGGMGVVYLCRDLVTRASLLMLPGTMFQPPGLGDSQIRIAFANVDTAGIAEVFRRLSALTL